MQSAIFTVIVLIHRRYICNINRPKNSRLCFENSINFAIFLFSFFIVCECWNENCLHLFLADYDTMSWHTNNHWLYFSFIFISNSFVLLLIFIFFKRARWEESLSLPISNNDTVYVTPSAGGPIVAFILNILRGYNFTSKAIESDDERLHTYHRFVEAYKFGKCLYT